MPTVPWRAFSDPPELFPNPEPMSGNTHPASLEDTFAQWFNFTEKRVPYGATLDELLKSCLYVESTPSTFSFSCAGPRDVPLNVQFEAFLGFTREHPLKPSLAQCLFPLFCHTVIAFRKNEDEGSVSTFSEAFLGSLPEDVREEAQQFVTDSEKYRSLLRLFSTQRYIVKMDDEAATLLNEFINRPANCELRQRLVEVVILDPDRVETPDRRTELRFPLESPTSCLSILQCRVRRASFAAVSNDLSEVFAVLNEQSVVKIDNGTNVLSHLYVHSATVTTMALSQEGRVLLTGDILGRLSLWSAGVTAHLTSVNASPWCSAFAPRGGIFAVGGADHIIRICDTPLHRQQRWLVGHTSPVTSVDFHPNCSLVGSLAVDPAVRVWDLRDAATVRLFIGRQKRNAGLAFSPDGKYLAYFDGDAIIVNDIGACAQVLRRPIALRKVVDVSFSMDSRFIYVVGPHGEIILCDTGDENVLPREILHQNELVLDAEMMPGNQLKLIVSSQG
jgi:transcription initiation factor TFIID subunit 5